MRKRIAILAGLLLLSAVPARAQDQWHFGFGTGFQLLSIRGDEGFATPQGPLILQADLESDEVNEYQDSAYGLGGRAVKGKWSVLWSMGRVELKDSLDGTLPGGASAAATVTYTRSGGELAVGYVFATTGKSRWGVLGGVRYTKHDYELDLVTGGNRFSRSTDQDWTDALAGFTHTLPFSRQWIWFTRGDVAFGGSDSTIHASTGISWRFQKAWTVGLSARYYKIDYENGAPGDPDFWLYDAEELSLGLGVNVAF